jgi:Outer membrane protein beta-barrel domain
MKKNILIVVALLVVQIATAQVRFGLKAGFTGASMKLTDPPDVPDRNEFMLPVFHAGILADIPLAKWFAIQPALYYSVAGYRTRPEQSTGNYYYIAKFRYNYLELPVNFLFKQRLGQGKIVAGFGPGLSYGIGGKATYIREGTKEETKRVKFDGDEVVPGNADEIHANPVDVSANFLLGYEFNEGFMLTAGYSSGFINVSTRENAEELNRSFRISFGYLFPRTRR